MKRLVLLISVIGIVFLVGCDNQIEENPEKTTTIEMKQKPKDTMLVHIDSSVSGLITKKSYVESIEIYDKDTGLLIYKQDQYPKMVEYFTGLGIIFMIIIAFVLINLLTNKKQKP